MQKVLIMHQFGGLICEICVSGVTQKVTASNTKKDVGTLGHVKIEHWSIGASNTFGVLEHLTGSVVAHHNVKSTCCSKKSWDGILGPTHWEGKV